jgi:hypothetical protein
MKTPMYSEFEIDMLWVFYKPEENMDKCPKLLDDGYWRFQHAYHPCWAYLLG